MFAEFFNSDDHSGDEDIAICDEWDDYKRSVKKIKKSNNYPKGSIEKNFKRKPEKENIDQSNSIDIIKGLKTHKESSPLTINSLRGKAKKRLKIDKTIDLHGYTLAQAYNELSEFLAKCFVNNERIVLVITGRGKALGMANNDDPLDAGEGRKTGVIRESFTSWINDPQFRSIISEVFQAPAELGGAGAFIVKLKKSR